MYAPFKYTKFEPNEEEVRFFIDHDAKPEPNQEEMSFSAIDKKVASSPPNQSYITIRTNYLVEFLP